MESTQSMAHKIRKKKIECKKFYGLLILQRDFLDVVKSFETEEKNPPSN